MQYKAVCHDDITISRVQQSIRVLDTYTGFKKASPK
jgi:hypothetical protein